MTDKKTRTPKPIAVESRKPAPIPAPYEWWEESRCSTISEAEKWIKAQGKADTTYRIITIERELTLKIEQKRVASFA